MILITQFLRTGNVVPLLFNDNESMNYTIHLHQSSGEIQTVFTSDSKDEILDLWKQEKSADDEYTEFDVLLTLSFCDQVFDTYLIPASQQGN